MFVPFRKRNGAQRFRFVMSFRIGAKHGERQSVYVTSQLRGDLFRELLLYSAFSYFKTLESQLDNISSPTGT